MKKSTSHLLWLAFVLVLIVFAGVVFGGVKENFAANNACPLEIPCGSYLTDLVDFRYPDGRMEKVPRCRECIYRDGCDKLQCQCTAGARPGTRSASTYKTNTFTGVGNIDPDVDLCSRNGNFVFTKSEAQRSAPECGKPASATCATKNRALLDGLKAYNAGSATTATAPAPAAPAPAPAAPAPAPSPVAPPAPSPAPAAPAPPAVAPFVNAPLPAQGEGFGQYEHFSYYY